jgi:hypothetical protein
MTEVLYIACPYTHPDPAIKEQRFKLATKIAALYVERGHIVYSPITHTHPLDVELAGHGTLGSDFWVKFDETFMAICSEMIIIKTDGWDKSSGIKREMEYFKEHGKPISFFLPEFLPEFVERG